VPDCRAGAYARPMPRAAPRPLTLAQLRAHAIARSLFTPTTLPRAIARLGFVQIDPLRAPARAQDLTLRLRVAGYRAGDLDARYPRLALEEDYFVNHGILPRATAALMHPRAARRAWPEARWQQAREVQAFVRARGTVHPREVDAAFAHGPSRNWFGGTGRASTELLDGMHYRGLLRIAGRAGNVRLYAARDPAPPAADPDAALDALADVLVGQYAPLPAATLGQLLSLLLGGGAPQWQPRRAALLARTRARLPQAVVDGQTWLWPVGEDPGLRRHATRASADRVRLLAPFDPLVWDRRRFEAFWGWPYRFEAYTPAAKRLRGHYALPLLWRDAVVGWGNLSVQGGQLRAELGYVAGRPPADAGYAAALDEELQRFSDFLGLGC